MKHSAHYLALAFTWLALLGPAQATVYSNAAPNSDPLYYFGSAATDSSTFGQHFVAPSEKLESFVFHAQEGYRGYLNFVIASWDGQKAVGNPLFTRSNIFYNASAEEIGSSAINLALTAGKEYVAFITTAGVTNPVSYVQMFGSNSNGGLNGNFASLSSGNTNPLSMNDAWQKTPVSMSYTASFSAPVPEPETYALIGLGLVALFARQRKLKAGKSAE